MTDTGDPASTPIPPTAVDIPASPPLVDNPDTARRGNGDVVALGFATAVATWVVSYIGRMPGMVTTNADGSHSAVIPAPVLFVLLALTLVGGGFVSGRVSPRGWKAGLGAGTIASLLNLIIFASLIRNDPTASTGALPLLGGFLVIGAVLGWLGGVAGQATRKAAPRDRNWLGLFARVCAVTVLLMLAAGGIVTSARAGLAVPDWPNSEGYLMVLYPLSHMTGGKFYEHAHRLYGILTGLATLVLTLWILRSDPRRWLKGVAVATLLLVIVQGVLGGLRVTGNLTTSMAATDLAPNLALAVVHGVLGQVFFALIIAIAAFCSCAWKRLEPFPHESAKTSHQLGVILVVAVIIQVVTGALLRHLGIGDSLTWLVLHIGWGLAVAGLGVLVAVRCAAMYAEQSPLLRKLGKGLTHVIGLQIVLGFVAWGFGGGQAKVSDGTMPDTWTLVFPTIHQWVGAMVVAWIVLLVVWTRRLVRQPDSALSTGANTAGA